MDDSGYTIARAAAEAHVGVETVRYYERRGLIAQPTQLSGAYRRYSRNHVARIRFIKRAQDLGFSLNEVEELLALQDGTARAEVRRIASARLAEIRARLKDLRRMEKTLAELIDHCRHGDRAMCPIIEALASDGRASSGHVGESARSRMPTRIAGATAKRFRRPRIAVRKTERAPRSEAHR